jgi:hypothetical protein
MWMTALPRAEASASGSRGTSSTARSRRGPPRSSSASGRPTWPARLRMAAVCNVRCRGRSGGGREAVARPGRRGVVCAAARRRRVDPGSVHVQWASEPSRLGPPPPQTSGTDVLGVPALYTGFTNPSMSDGVVGSIKHLMFPVSRVRFSLYLVVCESEKRSDICRKTDGSSTWRGPRPPPAGRDAAPSSRSAMTTHPNLWSRRDQSWEMFWSNSSHRQTKVVKRPPGRSWHFAHSPDIPISLPISHPTTHRRRRTSSWPHPHPGRVTSGPRKETQCI